MPITLEARAAAQIAPSYDVSPVRCLCSHARLMHDDEGRCLSRACGCAVYREDTRGVDVGG